MDPKQFLARLKTLASALSPGQMATLAVTFLVIVAIIAGSAFWLNTASYALLYADMDPEAASEIVAKLKAQKIPYQLDAGGRAVRVPSDKVDELRLDIAGQMPSSGRIGFEIFDRTAFGATDFLEQVNYRRALEGEIARTISTISDVAGARVHIALSKESIFGERQQTAKASVVLKLKRNRPLPASAVNGIRSLLAGSVEGLRPESVTVMDSFARQLSRPSEDAGSPLDGAQLERQQQLERDLSQKVIGLLEPVVGENRVRVNVSARINPQTQEETEERFDPNGVVRSRQVTSDSAAAPSVTGGVAGTRGNAPTAAPPTVTATPVAGRSAETTNYEVSKVTKHTVRPRGEIARLSVAVILDDEQVFTKQRNGTVKRTTKPRTPPEIQKIQGLVAAAVGVEQSRGDQLTVENIAFDEPAIDDVQEPGVMERYGPQLYDGGRVLVVLVLGLLAFVFFVRPMTKRVFVRLPVLAAQAAPFQRSKTVEEMQTEIEAQLQAAESRSEPRKLAALNKRLATMTQKEPEAAARLLRSWLTEDGR